MKPDDAAHMSAEPLDGLTTARAAYVRHALPDVEPKDKRVWLPNPAELDDLTNYRKEYTRKGRGKAVIHYTTRAAPGFCQFRAFPKFVVWDLGNQ